MHFFVIFLFVVLNIVLGSIKEVQILNKCPFIVWPAIKSDRDVKNSKIVRGKDFQLKQWETFNFSVAANWSGQIWGKTKCPPNRGICETGGCVDNSSPENICDVIALNPVSVANLQLGEFSNENGTEFEEDKYSVSLLSGYNLPIQIRPYYQSIIKKTNRRYDCNINGCFRDINSVCPENLSKRNQHGLIVGCKWKPTLENYENFIEACPDTIIYYNNTEKISNLSFSNGELSCKSQLHGYSVFQVIFCA